MHIYFTHAQNTAIQLLGELGPCSLSTLLKQGNGAFDCKTKLYNVIEQLCAMHKVVKQSNGYCRLSQTKAGTAKPSQPKESKQAVLTAQTQDEQTVIEVALDSLKEKLSTKTPPPISDITIKIKTLTELSKLLDPSISKVLNDVCDDLKSVAA